MDKFVFVGEPIPEDSLGAEVVLHVRKHLRRKIRGGNGVASDLALLFGLSENKGRKLGLGNALQAKHPIQKAAQLISQSDPKVAEAQVVEMGFDNHHIERCRKWLLKRVLAEPAFSDIVAFDTSTLLVLSKAKELASSHLPVLIEGETGAGKELLAQAIHKIWARENKQEGPFQPVQISGLPPDLVGSELFGHVKGAFTGATSNRKGKLTQADGGTLLIDEVGDLSSKAQIQLLRFLQDGKFSPLGSDTEKQVHVRIISATWHDIEQKLEEGTFRRDLFHRLRVGWLKLPPLRDRTPTVSCVVEELLKRKSDQKSKQISRRALDALAHYPWPGNLRELDGVVELVLANSHDDGAIHLEDLPYHVQTHYLALPLNIRTVGSICDLGLVNSEFVEEALQMEVMRVNNALEETTEIEIPLHHQEVHAYLSAIPDESEDHVAAKSLFDGYMGALKNISIADAQSQFWAFVLKQGLPQELKNIVKREITNSTKLSQEEQKKSQQYKRDFENSDSPWFRLWSEARSIPGLDLDGVTGLLISFSRIAGPLFAYLPDLAEALRTKIKEGGIVGLGLEAKRVLTEETETIELENTSSPKAKKQPEKLSKNEWKEHWEAGGHKIAAVARRTGYDHKTVKKYLEKYGIE